MIRVCIFLALLSISFADNVKFKDCGKCKLYERNFIQNYIAGIRFIRI